MRKLFIVFAFAPLMAYADSTYRVDMGTEVRGNNLSVEPTVVGPAEKSLQYEMKVRREGQGHSPNSSQSGPVRLHAHGHGKLAPNSVNVLPSDHYEITGSLFDGGQLVAGHAGRHP